MKPIVKISGNVEQDIRSYFQNFFGYEYGSTVPEDVIEEIAEDVKASSDYEHGTYNDTDIQWATARVILYRLGVYELSTC